MMNAQQQPYGFEVDVDLPFDQAVEQVTVALKAEGFGVLTTIDVKQTMKQKLGLDFEPYTILGACNPQLAHRALEEEHSIGLLLPCNVVVHEHGNWTRVEVADPIAMLGGVQNPAVQAIAEEAAERLHRVIDTLGAGIEEKPHAAE
jgi:uncharacterized protein (DUF302 family)